MQATAFSQTNKIVKKTNIMEIRYRFSAPDPWRDDFWKLENQDDSYW